MRAAIYARKSTDDNDRNAENKSVTRQIEHARKYIAGKGWTVSEEHIYVDDGISGAEFKKRPGLLRMLNAVRQFDVIVMSELSRLGREQTQTAQILAEIYGKGKRVLFYLTDEELKFKSAVEKFMVGAVAFGAELEREKAAQRSLDALTRKAAKGYNAGGVCFGYDNVPVYGTSANGEQVKSHTDYRINRQQADLIRGMFRAYADGHGHTAIAKALNGNTANGKRLRTLRRDLDAIRKKYFTGCDVTAPKRGKRGTGSWAPSAVREILYRERYTGKVPFNGSFTERPDLRIVEESLWKRAQLRLKEVRAAYIRDGGQWWGRPSSEKYLLSGMGRCTCGKSITVIDGYNGTGQRHRAFWYGCSYHHTRGNTVCSNGNRARMDWLDGSVIAAIEQQVLTPQAIAFTIEEAARQAARELRAHPEKPRKLEAEANKVRKELDRFLSLVAEGKAPDSVLAEIKRREERLGELQREQEALKQQAKPAMGPAEIREMCGERLKRFKDLLRKDVPVARQALRKLLPEPLRFQPVTVDGKRTLRFEGVTVLGPLLEEVRKGVASPRGFEPRLPP